VQTLQAVSHFFFCQGLTKLGSIEANAKGEYSTRIVRVFAKIAEAPLGKLVAAADAARLVRMGLTGPMKGGASLPIRKQETG
jgi:hypothetical protein